eukprot:7142914-Pyramimonas_sp.AAC.1
MVTFLHVWKVWGGREVYRHRACRRLVRRAGRRGNPGWNWAHRDEQENRAMGTAAKSCHAGPLLTSRCSRKSSLTHQGLHAIIIIIAIGGGRGAGQREENKPHRVHMPRPT